MKGTIVKKSNKVSTDKPVEAKPTGIPVHKGWGILMLFVVASVLYANYVVYFGTTGIIPKIMLIPSTLFVAIFLVLKAAK
jgi:hypothetical protein